MRWIVSALVVACLSLPLASGVTKAAENLSEAIMNGKPNVDIRYRYEGVNQDGFSRNARASTLRTRLGYRTDPLYGFHAFLEVESTQVIGGERYNSTTNGNTKFPTVADPESTEVNQAYLHVDGPLKTLVRFGRQKVVLDNQRFVGAVGFRQNEQTFDALAVISSAIPDTRLIYGYVFNINRIFGSESSVGEFDTATHLINLSYLGLPFGTITTYGYLLDVQDADSLSSKSFGLRFSGKQALGGDWKAIYAIEYAHQNEYADNPSNFSLNYGLVEPGIAYKGLTVKLGYEVLEADGTNAFQTPLATGHAFNGITDKFLTTPSDGIEDRYIKLKYVFAKPPLVDKITLNAAYHDFDTEQGSSDHGEEWNAKVAVKLNKNFLTSLQYADYQADTFGTDTKKFWATLQFKY